MNQLSSVFSYARILDFDVEDDLLPLHALLEFTHSLDEGIVICGKKNIKRVIKTTFLLHSLKSDKQKNEERKRELKQRDFFLFVRDL